MKDPIGGDSAFGVSYPANGPVRSISACDNEGWWKCVVYNQTPGSELDISTAPVGGSIYAWQAQYNEDTGRVFVTVDEDGLASVYGKADTARFIQLGDYWFDLEDGVCL